MSWFLVCGCETRRIHKRIELQRLSQTMINVSHKTFNALSTCVRSENGRMVRSLSSCPPKSVSQSCNWLFSSGVTEKSLFESSSVADKVWRMADIRVRRLVVYAFPLL